MKQNYFRRTLSALLLFVSTLSWANIFEVDGIHYNTYKDGTSVRVTYGSEYYSGDIVIPSTVTYGGRTYNVTGIGYTAFFMCTSLTSITLPEGLTDIDNMAFNGCKSLTSINIPSSVTSIGNATFGNCSSLLSISIPDCVTTIGIQTFSGCSSLASVIIGSGVTSIEEGAFRGCTSLVTINIPAGVTTIGDNAFEGCSSLAAIDLPAGLTGIGERTFGNCRSLRAISIPAGVTTIGKYAFSACVSLATIDLPADLMSIGNEAFYACFSLTSVICRAEDAPQLESDVFRSVPLTQATLYVPPFALDAYKAAAQWQDFEAIIGTFEADGICYNVNNDRKSVAVTYKAMCYPNYFAGYSGDIVIPSTVTYMDQTYSVIGIGESAFYNCASLSSVSIPESVTGIGDWAFGECRSLTSIDIPGGVTSIGNYVFSGCPSLVTLKVSAANPIFDSREGCNAIINTSTNTLIAGCRNTTIPSNVTGIGDAAFLNCYSLASVDIPASVMAIGDDVFSGCPSITTMTVSAANPVYDSREGCNAIIRTFDNTLIAGCPNTIIPNSVTVIGENAFCDCTSLTTMSIPEGVTSIGDCAFWGCTSLASLICRAENVPELGYSVFRVVPQSDVTLYVPLSAIEAYKTADEWSDFGTILPLEDYETAIDAPTQDNSTLTAPYYTSGGQRVTAPVRGGIYIHKGRKVLMR